MTASRASFAWSTLIDDPLRAANLAKAGRAWILERFDLANSLDPLVALFAQKLGRAHSPSRAQLSATMKANVQAMAASLDEWS